MSLTCQHGRPNGHLCPHCGPIDPGAHQPEPEANDSPPIWDLVIADMRERNLEGLRKYGTPPQVSNGSDALVDAYQKALDLAVCLRQEIEERRLAQTRPSDGRWTQEDDDFALAMADQGWTHRRIAGRLDRTAAAVAARLSRLRRGTLP